jgi:hypothetical protein
VLLHVDVASAAFTDAKSIGERPRYVPLPTLPELRRDIFNLLNRANFDLPNRIFGSPGFSAKDPRQMQFGVRLTF